MFSKINKNDIMEPELLSGEFMAIINSGNTNIYPGLPVDRQRCDSKMAAALPGDSFISASKNQVSTGLISPDILKKKNIRDESVQEKKTLTSSEKVSTSPSLNEQKDKSSQVTQTGKIYEPSLYKRFTARTKHYLQQFLAVTMLAGALTTGPVSAATTSFDRETNKPVAERVEGSDGNDSSGSLRKLMDGAKSAAQKVEDFGDRFEEANKLQRKIGDYDLKIKFMDPSIDIKPRLNPRIKDGELELKGKAYIKTEMDLLETQLSKQEQQGEWLVTKGFRGKIDSEYKLGYAGKWSNSQDLHEEEKIDEMGVSAHLHGFMQWDRDFGEDVHLKMGVSAGVSHNITENDTTLNVKGEQKLTGSRVQIFGHNFRWVAEAEEEVKYSIQNDRLDAEYEIVAGLQKKIPVTVMGKKIDIDFTVGPGIKGDTDNFAGFKPMAKLKALF